MSIQPAIRRAIRRSIRQAIGVDAGGTPAVQFVATPSTATPVAGVAVTWSTNAGDLGTPVSYSWDFGDGTIPKTGATPPHYWVTTGSYTVTCVVTMDDASTYTDTQEITVSNASNSTAYDSSETVQPDPSLWSTYLATVTANSATAPDATNTAALIDDGASNDSHQVYINNPIYPADTPFRLKCWFKDVDRRYAVMTIYTSGKWVAGLFDLQAGTVADTDYSGADWSVTGSGISSVGSGWYECWIDVTISAAGGTSYLIISPSNSTTIGSGGLVSYTGSNKQFLAWHPTIVSDTASYQFVARQDFTADVTNAISVPGGAKLSATAGIGWSGMLGTDGTTTNFTTCTINASVSPHVDRIPRLYGGWFKFESTTGDSILVGITQYTTFVGGWKIEGGNLTANGNVIMAVPVGSWIYIGMSVGFGSSTAVATRCWYRILDDDLTLADSSNSSAVDGTAVAVVVGTWSQSGNSGAIGRISLPSSYTIANIDDPGYPDEIVPPQVDNYIYRVDPVGGDDANDGVTGAWETITRVNAMLAGSSNSGYPWQSIVSTPASSSPGTGAWLEIDTSVEKFDVGTVGLQVYVPGLWVKAKEGNTWITYRPYVDISSGDWSATGGHANTYQIPCVGFTYSRLFETSTTPELYKSVADLTALDAETDGAFTWISDVLYLKSSTNPASNGKTYLYTRNRPSDIGRQVISVGSSAVRISDSHIWYTAYDNNGSYCIGDTTGFSGELLVEHFDCRYTDKHAICYVIDATNSTITTNNGVVEQGLSQPLTSYMNTGSGNEHTWSNINVTKDWLRENMPAGDYGFGAFYSHGGGDDRFAFVAIVDCDFGLCDVLFEVSATELRLTDSVCGTVVTQRDFTATGSEFYLAASVFEWSIQSDFTMTNCIVRTAGAPMIRDLVAANVIACDNNTYYFPAASVFANDFNAGGGPADYTFAQWQALGYDTHSTRLDP